MKQDIPLESILPEVSELLNEQGWDGQSNGPWAAAASGALAILKETVQCRAIRQDTNREEFSDCFRGEGLNETPSPLEAIVPRAHRLALFALTMGDEVSNAIEGLFRGHDFPLAYLLDQAASVAANRAVTWMEREFEERGQREGPEEGIAILSYSPGYCGWHVSGQKKLFARLHPEKIGIALTDGYLMRPLKSVTGVLVAAKPEVHRFSASYSFCRPCRDRTCGRRIKGIVEKASFR